MAGAEVGSIELSDKIYGIEEINSAVLHAAVECICSIRDRVLSPLLPVPRYPAEERSLGDRRVPVEQDRVPPALPSGHTVA